MRLVAFDEQGSERLGIDEIVTLLTECLTLERVDIIEVEIESIGVLRNPIKDEA